MTHSERSRTRTRTRTRTRWRRGWLQPAAVATAAAAFSLAGVCGLGCGGPTDSYERFPVQGSVQRDGEPLKSGTISFIPDGPGASSSADVVDGGFDLGSADGLSPGAYRVEVYSIQPTGRQIASADDPGAQVEETANLVDRRFNIDSTLKADIPAGGPKEPLSFDVASPSPTKAARSKRR